MKIRRLSADLANQIAAGEVVERPASVVKELVENAIDAGATRIKVEIEQGGAVLVRVSDDGEGMAREDAELALERHATSKIVSADDLFRLGTFGFRGEALPSIASVSKLSLITRTRDADEATEVVLEGGGTPRVRPTGAAPGTIVTVAELFFNVPARRKFLKSTATEGAHVGEVILLAALARPNVTFTLLRDGRVVREHLRAASREERARQAFEGDKLAKVAGARGPIHIEGFLAAPERARAGATGLHLFVNGRPVKDRSLARAVAQSYGSVLEGGRYPIGAVYIDLPPELVDVNVHPQKAEVRFQDGRGIFDAVSRELHGELAKAFAIPSVGPVSHPWQRTPNTGWASRPSASPGASSPASWSTPTASASATSSAAEPPAIPHSTSSLSPSILSRAIVDAAAAAAADRAAPAEGRLFDEERGFYAQLRFLAQVRSMFLLCEADDGLYVLDQHAAAERVTFDRLRRGYAAKHVVMQRLLLPEVVELAAGEVEVLEAHADEVAALGMEIRAAGANAVAVHAVPQMLVRATPVRLVRDLVAELARDATRPFGGAVDLVLATMACHGSVRAGDIVSADEARALLRALDDVDFAGHCPHGRPVVTRLPFSELERRVGR